MNIIWQVSLDFNTNVLETNVLNLAVVIGVLVVLGGDVLTSLLDARRERIVQSVQSAETRFQEAQEKLEQAKARLAEATEKATVIRSQGEGTVQVATATLQKQAEEEIARLEEVKNSTLGLAEQKATKEVQQHLAALALEKASAKLQTKLKSTSVQKQLADFQIATLSKSSI